MVSHRDNQSNDNDQPDAEGREEMREIKFRCWNARSGMMFFDLGETLPEPVHNYYIGQYTGLKDTNGVEIYEGDIVKYHEEPSSSMIWESRVVEFSNGAFSPLPGYTYSDDLSDFSNEDVEVVGNVHEHPELLK